MTTPTLQLWPTMRRVERTAWNAIVRCVKVRKLAAMPLPIPVEEWIEGPLGIRFDITDLSHEGDDVLGAACVPEREIKVSDKLVTQNARFRFTAAHELGHILLHGRIASNFRDSEDADYLERKIEREADRFAAAFLMPIPALCAELVPVVTNLWSDPQSLLAAVVRGDDSASQTFAHSVLPHLTRRFGVSTAAAVRRFSDVQFPSGEPALPYQVGLRFVPAEQMREALRRQ